MKPFPSILALGLGAALSQANADSRGVMKFKTSRTIASLVLTDVCRPRTPGTPQEQVTVLRNSQGEIGGYISQLLILDSGIDFLDCDGELLTSFHIFAADEEKDAASRIIAELTKQFPVREVLACPK